MSRIRLGEGPTEKGMKFVGYQEGKKLYVELVEAYGSCDVLDTYAIKDMQEMEQYIFYDG
jgi:hypothetical protein